MLVQYSWLSSIKNTCPWVTLEFYTNSRKSGTAHGRQLQEQLHNGKATFRDAFPILFVGWPRPALSLFLLFPPLPPLLLSVFFFGSNACIWNINREFHILSLSPPRCAKICTMKRQSDTAREGKVGEESVQLARLTVHAYLPHRN